MLDVLRGLAATAVVIHHVFDLSGGKMSSWSWLPEGFGEWGVDLFFVVSAFLLCEYFWRPKNDRSLRVFYTRRFFRIGPPYFVMLVLLVLFSAPATAVFSEHGYKQILANATFMQGLSPYYVSSFGVNGVLWTLTLEVLLYATLPLLAWLIGRWPIIAGSLLFAIGVAYRVWVSHWANWLIARYFHQGPAAEWLMRLFVLRQYLGILPVFVIGIMARWLVVRGPLRNWSQKPVSKAPVIILLVALIPSVIYLKSIYRSSLYIHTVWFVALDVMIAALFVPVLLLASKPVTSRPSLLFGIGRWFGDRSYSLYLWHFPVILAVFEMGASQHPAVTTHFTARVVLIAILALLFAHFGYVLIEKPGIASGQRVARRLAPMRTATQAPSEASPAVSPDQQPDSTAVPIPKEPVRR
jgi:peptidoglycan/LPS O-acetylase OafA/YrhL